MTDTKPTGQEREDIIIEYLLRLFNDSKPVESGTLKFVQVPFREQLISYGIRELDEKDITRLIPIMLELDLIRDFYGTTYKIWAFGRQVKREGGWLEYLKQQKQDKIDQRNNIRASIRTSNSVLKNQRRQNVIIFITCISGFIAAIATVGQWRIAARQELQNKCKPKQQRLCTACHSGRNHNQLVLPKNHKQTLTPSP